MPNPRHLAAALIASACSFAGGLAFRAPSTGTIEPYFAPGTDPAAALIRETDAATAPIRGEFYDLTDADFAEALIRAHHRGVDVQLILDEHRGKLDFSQSHHLAAGGVIVYLDGAHPIHHTKLLIIGDSEIIQGSYNPSLQAHKNAEQLQVQKHFPALAAAYLANWQKHLAHSYRLTTDHPTPTSSPPATPPAGGEGDTS